MYSLRDNHGLLGLGTTMALQNSSGQRGFDGLLSRTLGAPLRQQTYRNLCYLVLMFPLGIIYFNILLAGLLTGVGLLIVLVGIPLLVLTLWLAVRFAGLERRLVKILLGIDVTPPAYGGTEDLTTRLKRQVIGRQTWTTVAYLLSEFVYGSVAFGLVSSLLATAGSFLLAPLYYHRAPVVAFGPIPSGEFTLNLLFGWDSLLVGLTTTFQLGSWEIATLPGALLVATLGFVILLAALHLCNALTSVWGRYAHIMLS